MRYHIVVALGGLVAGGLAMGAWAAPLLTEASVGIANFSFGPGQIVVARGTKVTWSNRDDIPHMVTDAAEQRDFKSPPLDSGEHYAHVFSKPGIYHYFCSLHPKMQGTVVVN